MSYTYPQGFTPQAPVDGSVVTGYAPNPNGAFGLPANTFPPFPNLIGADPTGVTESTAAFNAAITRASLLYAGTGQEQTIYLGVGTYLVNKTQAVVPIPSGIRLTGVSMGVVYDYSYGAYTQGQWFSGTTILDAGWNGGDCLHVIDPNWPGPEAEVNQIGQTLTKSSGAVLENFNLCALGAAGGASNGGWTGGGSGRTGIHLEALTNCYLRNVRVQHYNDGNIQWNPEINFLVNDYCTFYGSQFRALSANTGVLPPFTATSNATWQYVGNPPNWSTASQSGASCGIKIYCPTY